jgi:hypothetical protein
VIGFQEKPFRRDIAKQSETCSSGPDYHSRPWRIMGVLSYIGGSEAAKRAKSVRAAASRPRRSISAASDSRRRMICALRLRPSSFASFPQSDVHGTLLERL